jgi:heme-degrading monooxygenase HmoA
MYTRIVSFTIKPGNNDNVNKVLQNEIVPALRQQPGFVDFVGLADNSDPHQFLSITFWNSKADADRYNREQFQELLGLVKPYLSSSEVREYNVEHSSVHRISPSKAA